MNNTQQTSRFSRGFYRVTRRMVQFFYPKTVLHGLENLPAEPCILVGNHTRMNGPLIAELSLPGDRAIWCAGQMMHRKDVAAYAFQDFWSTKPKWTHPFYRLLSHLIVPLSVCIFNNAHTIAVYHDARIVSTFRRTMERLDEGANIVIYSECAIHHNHIINEFQDKFIDVARLYYKKTGKTLSFVPMYLAPTLRQGQIGTPIVFRPDVPVAEERQRICQALMDGITALAESMPLHRVVPYNPEIPRKHFPYNLSSEVNDHEKTGC